MYRIAEFAGLSYPTLIEKVIADAIQRPNWFFTEVLAISYVLIDWKRYRI